MEYYRSTDTFKKIAKSLEENGVDLSPFEILSHALATDDVGSISPLLLKAALDDHEKNTKVSNAVLKELPQPAKKRG